MLWPSKLGSRCKILSTNDLPHGGPLGWQVACLADGDARLALEKGDPWAVQTKPHGHGDVHGLLHSSGLAARWAAAGLRWVCFFQDTNGLVFRALPAALGVC